MLHCYLNNTYPVFVKYLINSSDPAAQHNLYTNTKKLFNQMTYNQTTNKISDQTLNRPTINWFYIFRIRILNKIIYLPISGEMFQLTC